MNDVYVGLGSNTGDAAAWLRAAVEALRGLPGIRLAGLSPVYLTEPQGDPDQPWFANQVARLALAPAITPSALLGQLHDIERALGRTRDPQRRYGPRTIDLDLLVFGKVQCTEANLTLPHPRLHERAFVLVPLCDLAPELEVPGGGNVRDLLQAVPHSVQGQRIFQSLMPETSQC